LEIIYLKQVDSTHNYLKQYIKDNGYINPLAVVTTFQTNGIGSRNNSWEGRDGNLFFSFVIDKEKLPFDLPLSSASIYFSYILKDILKKYGSKVWIKWPNDFYIDNKKVGGTITTVSGNLLYCGIGLNLLKINNEFGYLDIIIDIKIILDDYFTQLLEFPSWKNIFSKFLLEFHLSKSFITTIENKKVSLKDAILNDDGSLTINNKKVFGLR